MKAMIFSAGLGTRFKPWTDKHPKALAVINGKSLLQRNIEYLQQFGITDVVVNVHHFADQVMDAILRNKGWGSNVIISDEQDVVLETGGGLVKAKILLEGDEPFLTVNVDILTNLDISAFLEFHKKENALISIAVLQRKTSRYFLLDEESHLCGWINTQTGEEKMVHRKENLQQKAYSGIAIFQPEVFSYLPKEGKFSLATSYLEIAATNTIAAYDHTGDKWVDVGKPESVAIAEAMF
ncbi:nucleotidyltransferase family protein [Pinibacter aurantiacus]|uniref:Nucleotidyltransferase family protein n=1 Tax=Pinibacter aurantiacus TaxID=2851599 RepID=A0A9E2W4P6_9BACT|nr:nucleotidyltransferase family protein [Pinibacter aurantiacus]MBV4358039.1 nucleotidyltransferase family protein [Pinibacter aurantiacus]